MGYCLQKLLLCYRSVSSGYLFQFVGLFHPFKMVFSVCYGYLIVCKENSIIWRVANIELMFKDIFQCCMKSSVYRLNITCDKMHPCRNSADMKMFNP